MITHPSAPTAFAHEPPQGFKGALKDAVKAARQFPGQEIAFPGGSVKIDLAAVQEAILGQPRPKAKRIPKAVTCPSCSAVFTPGRAA